MVNDGGPAFPIYPRTQGMETRELKDQVGMSLRDYFAANALQGMLACPIQPQSGADMYARDAFTLADAMLEERKK